MRTSPKNSDFPFSVVLAGSAVPVCWRSIPCFVSAAFVRHRPEAPTEDADNSPYFLIGRVFYSPWAEKKSLIRAETGNLAVGDRFRRTASTTTKSMETTVATPVRNASTPPPNQGIIALICKDAVAIRTPNKTRRATRVSLR